MTSDPRPATALDALADEYFHGVVALSPVAATYLGVPGSDDRLDDYTPDGLAAHAALRADILARIPGLPVVDDVDAVTAEALRERLGLAQERYEAGLDEMALNVIASPLQEVREIVDLMPTGTAEDWATIAARLSAMPLALEQWHVSLLAAAGRGQVSARRQVLACLDQAGRLVLDDGYFATLAPRARLADGAELPAAVRTDLDRAVRAAADGYRAAATRLREDILPLAPEADAVGRDRYALESRYFLGAAVDLDETYAWGAEELARITADMEQLAGRICGASGASVEEAVATLDADPRYRLEGTAALRAWMQTRSDEAIEALSGSHFDIPEPVRRLECLIAPTDTGGIYYTGPSDDFSRPGRMWWSVPPGETTFGTWRELTTVYHEGVPGHHLQIGQTIFRSGLLNRWRRQLSGTSGHAEGWALYAERLMVELGFMDDLGDRLGWLDAQSLRAARVVLDIGIHCHLPAPESVGGGAWDYDKAWAFFTRHAHLTEGFLRSELDRYLGWPGQAPSYKVGERLWLELRAEATRREGPDFDLAGFHRRALDIGGVGLDTLHRAVLGG